MKKHLIRLFFLAAIVVAGSLSASAQIYVHVRPVAPVVVRTEAPSPRHVWIGEDWVVRDGAYVHTGGRWEEPPHNGMVWVAGHWTHGDRGHYWKAGHWRRR
jgi:hypothetical protein